MATLSGTLRSIVTYGVFKYNQAEIARTICVKRAIKANTCQGRCALKKQLKALEAEQEKNKENRKKYEETVSQHYFNTEPFTFSVPNTGFITTEVSYPPYPCIVLAGVQAGLLRPPRA